MIPKKQLAANTPAGAALRNRLIVENGPTAIVEASKEFPAMGFGGEEGEDDIFGGDVSSIMIKPDQILHDRNIADE